MSFLKSFSSWKWGYTPGSDALKSTLHRPNHLRSRRALLESLEARVVYDADPIWVGGVYIEADQGSDLHGDDFYITFKGGAADTQLTKLTIDLDQNAPGIGVADNLFDIQDGGLGADHAYNFRVEQLEAGDLRARVTATVVDGGSKLILNFENFFAGDRLYFSIDVDEVQHFDPSERDLEEINLGLDPITSGVEFQGSKLQATFSAPHYFDIEGNTTFLNRYDTVMAPTGLDLPADNDNGLRDRSAGAAFSVTQLPKPISIAGTVYVDNNVNLERDNGEQGLSGVSLELFRKQGSQYIATGHRTTTDTQGRYTFGINLNLMPGTYQIRESQPNGYFSVGATPGLLDGASGVGQIVAGNRDILTEIVIPMGDQHATELNFAEAQPASIRGFVYEDRNDNGDREANEPGISGVEIRLEVIDALATSTTLTVRTRPDGSYAFENLAPGTYRIVESTQPANFFDGQDTPGAVGGAARGESLVNDAITNILLNGNDVGVEYNFGELPPSSLSGHVCVAMPGFDCFSSLPGGIEPLPGVRLELINDLGEVVATTTSAADGSYRFDRLPAGVYTIVESTPEELLDGHSRRGTIDGNAIGDDSDPSRITEILVGVGQTGVHYDFCELRPSSLSGHVFEDMNDDGFRQPNEPLLPNATVTLYDGEGNEVAQIETDAQGFYRFTRLRPGSYTILETTPEGYIDGKDRVGTIQGTPVGTLDSEADIISDVLLPSGRDGINYDFGELRPASIAGRVIVDSNGNCIIDAEFDRPLPDVLIELRNEQGHVIESTFTDEDGRYRFEALPPGRYSIREYQPADLHQGDASIGSGDGRVDGPDNLVDITLGSGAQLVDYDFCEIPPAIISGFVFQDGPTLLTPGGLPPAKLRPTRDGIRDPNDIPIGGVVLELRAVSGQPVSVDEALAGIYEGTVITVRTDAEGYFEFAGLKPGIYHVYQRQPAGFTDALDTAGSTGGSPLNPEDAISDADVAALLAILRQNSTTDPGADAILKISIRAGESSIENNFSEVRLGIEAPPPSEPPPSDPPVPPILPPPPNYIPPLTIGYVGPPFERVLVSPPAIPFAPPLIPSGGAPGEYTWHLSVINAGMPRGSQAGRKLSKEQLAAAAFVLDVKSWSLNHHDPTQWTYVSNTATPKDHLVRRQAFDIDGARSLAGDFNGDGQDELALFLDGEWLVDINGNGRWDHGDMWARLGAKGDLPVIGDWDGDGKDDIGIFGPEWPGDERALAYEPGLPDPDNRIQAKPKNIPPEHTRTPDEERLLQRSSEGPARSDIIDHVFRFGADKDQPVAGDFNGDGISSLGIFRNGKWRLDTNGDGKWSSNVDKMFDFGQSGDIAVVGDFNGDGIDEVAVVRGNRLIIDSNRNQELDATDQVIELQGNAEDIVIGDFDGDGADEAAAIQRGRRISPELTREARKAS